MSTRFINLKLQRTLQITLGVVDIERPNGDAASTHGTKATKACSECAHWYSCGDRDYINIGNMKC